MYRGFAQLSWDLGTLFVGFPLLSEEAHPSFWNKCWELTVMLVLAFWVLVRGIWRKLTVPSSRLFSISSKLFPALWMQFLNFSYCSPVCLEGDEAESFPPSRWLMACLGACFWNDSLESHISTMPKFVRTSVGSSKWRGCVVTAHGPASSLLRTPPRTVRTTLVILLLLLSQ